jgi:tetratricopeptide (TPR) repeat protein
LISAANDPGEQCRLLGVIGNAYFSQGLFDQAIENYGKGLEIARQIGDRASEAIALRDIGLIMGWRGQLQKALEHLDQALAIARAISNRETERQIVFLIGNIYFEQGELTRATESYQQSLEIARAIGRRRGECRIAVNMGEICRQQGNLNEAKFHFNEARAIAEEIQDRETEGQTLSNLGLLHHDSGDLDMALKCFHQALNIFRETNYRSNVEAEALSGIARIYWQQDKVTEAKEYFEKAAASGRELGLWNLVVPSLRCLAACERTLSQPAAARARLNEAMVVLEEAMASKLSEPESLRCLQIKSELTQEIAALETE